MNTFLPCNDFNKIARILDPERLNRQISETCTIARSLWVYKIILENNDRQLPWGFSVPPVLSLWTARGEVLLAELWSYQRALNAEWMRHHNSTPHGAILGFNWRRLIVDDPPRPRKVEWPEEVLDSHKSKLMVKDASYYRRAFERNGLSIPSVGLSYSWQGPKVIP